MEVRAHRTGIQSRDFDIVLEAKTDQEWILAQPLTVDAEDFDSESCDVRPASLLSQLGVSANNYFVAVMLLGEAFEGEHWLSDELAIWGGPVPSKRIELDDLSGHLESWVKECEALLVRQIELRDFLDFDFLRFEAAEGLGGPRLVQQFLSLVQDERERRLIVWNF